MSVKTQRKDNAAPVSYKVKPARKPRSSASKTNGKRALSAYEHLHIGVVECSLDGRYMDVNEEFCRILGYSKEELLEMNVEQTTYEEDYALDIKLHEELIAGKIPFYGLEKGYVRKDGEVIWTELTRSLVRDAKGKPLCTMGVVVDISDYKHVERVLRESAENLRLATEAARMFKWELDFQKLLYTFADNFTQVLGFSAGLLPQNSAEAVWKLSPEEDVRAISEAIGKTVKNHTDLNSLQYRMINPADGQIVWLEVNAKVVYDRQGQPRRMFGVAQNITGNKRAQEEIRILSKLPEENPNPVMRLTPEGEVLYANYPGQDLLEVLKHQTDQTIPNELKKQLAAAFAGGIKKEIEITQNGKTFACTLAPIREAGYVNLYGNEITERRRTEQALGEYARQQEALYRLSDHLHHTDSLADVYQAALNAILSGLQCDRASILLFDDSGVMRFVAWHGLSDEYRQATEGHSPWGPDEKNPYPICMGDSAASDLSDSLKATIRKEGIASLSFIPLVSAGKLIGKFMVYFDSYHDCSDSEIELGLMIARQLASGIDRKRAEVQLRESEERYRTIVDTANEGIWYIDMNETTVYLNEPMANILGYSAEEVTGRKVPEFCFEEDVPKVQARITSNYAGNYESFDFRFRRRDGSEVLVLGSTSPVRDATGAIVGSLGMFVDVSDRKRNEERLRESEERLRVTFDTAVVGFATLTPAARFEEVNDAFCQIVGYTRPELLAMDCAALTHPFYIESTYEHVNELVEGKIPSFVLEKIYIRKDGSEIWVQNSVSVVRRADGTPLHLIAITQDITERKQAEEKLRASETLYRTIARSIPGGGVYVVDKDFRYRVAEGPVTEAFGLSREAIEGQIVWEAFPDERGERMKERLERSFAGETVSFETKYNGRVYWTQQAPLGDSIGQAIIVTLDITERKQTEEALRQSEERFARFMQHLPGLAWIKDLQGRYVYANATAEKAFSTPREELYGRTDAEIFPSRTAAQFQKNDEQALLNEKGIQTVETLPQEDGLLHYSLVTKFPIPGPDGNPILIGGTAFDITERLQAEQALRESEERYRSLFNLVPIAVYTCDARGVIQEYNQRAVELWGREPKLNDPQEAKYCGAHRLYYPDGRVMPQAECPMSRVLAGETLDPSETEVLVERPDGSRRSVIAHPLLLRNEQGQITEAINCLYDITERKQVEEALRMENERFMRFFNSNIVGILIGDTHGKVLLANDYYLHLLGVSRQDFNEGAVDWRQFTPPEWVPADEKAIQQLRERGVCDPYEKEYVRVDGTRVPVYIADAMLPGQGEEIAAFVLDITERKQADEALRESEERFGAILRQATAGIVRKDAEGRLIFVNEAYCDMLGYSEAELLDKNFWQFTYHEDIEENKRLYDRLMAEGIPFKLEKRIVRKDGSLLWVDTSVSPVLDAEGKPQSAVAVEVDITGRKQAEDALQQLNLQLESRVQKRTATIQAINQSLREEIAERKRIEEALRASEAIARASEEKLRTLFDLLPVGISFLDPEGQFLQMNSAEPNIVRLPKEQLLTQAYRSRKYIRPDGSPMSLTEFASARALKENKTVYNVETGIILENGDLIWTSVSAAPVDVADVGVVVVTVDITEKKRAEQALQESHRRLRILSQRLVEVQEEERQALARELHDRVGQTLAALNINLIIINGQLAPDLAQQIGARLNDSMKLVAETIALVRDVMTDLRPAVLDDYGLEAALESHVSGFKSRYNIRVMFERPERAIPRLGPSIEMTFLRIAQEALMNIAKHAHAEHISLSLRQEEETVSMTIQDDGIGIESWRHANRPGSHGLTIMRERAEAFGGTLIVKSIPGQGTTVETSIPFSKSGKKTNEEKPQEE